MERQWEQANGMLTELRLLPDKDRSPAPTHTNIIFDILLPYNFCLSDEAVKDIIAADIRELNPAYFAVIQG